MIRDADYQAAVYRESSRLADALVATGIEELPAQKLAIRCLSTRLGVPIPLDQQEQRILLTHAELVAQIQATLADEFLAQVRRTVTAAIVHRLPGCKGWTEADTAELPQPLQEAIAAFIDEERSGTRTDRSAEEVIDEMVTTLGKLGPDSSQSPPTGALSTGAVEHSGPLPQSSAATASPASPPTTSSKRSRKASAG